MSLTSVKEYFVPGGVDEALDLMGTHGDSALIVAGGSFVHGLDARDLLTGIEALIDISKLGLDGVAADSAGLSVGAMVTFRELQQDDRVSGSAAFGAIRDALACPPTQIRNVATVGGNIASSCPYFDLPTAAMALDGIVRAQGPAGSRDIPLQDFFASLFQNSLDANELVTGLLLPVLPAKTSSAFFKLETNANDLAIVNAAARISLDDSGNCTAARVVIGGGGAETPVRATSCENLLQGKQLSAGVLDQAAAAVPTDLQPMSDHRASGAYRAAMSKTLARRALARAVQRQEA